MAYQQNQTIGLLFSSLLGIAIYTFYLLRHISGIDFDPSTVSSYLGRIVLFAIGAQVVASIVLSILIAIIQAIINRDDDPVLSDERDRLFDLRSTRFAFGIFGSGFFLAMLSLAIGLPIVFMFNLIVYSLFGAGIVGYIAQLYYYRRGY